MRKDPRGAALLLAGAVGTTVAALLPAGLRGEPVGRSLVGWGVLAGAALLALAARGRSPGEVRRFLLAVLPVALLLAAPAAALAPPGRRLLVLGCLLARTGTAVLVAGTTALLLGPGGLVAALRALRVPAGFVDVLEAALASLVLLREEGAAMLRARRARHPRGRAFAPLPAAPRDTVLGYGRLVAALLLRALARAERRELARRARGART